MTEKELAEIEARANAATEGPWIWGAGYAQLPHPEQTDYDHKYGDCRLTGKRDVVIPLRIDHYKPEWEVDLKGEVLPAGPDRAFIAHARQDIPALIAEVRRLQKRIEEIEEERQWDSYGEDL